MVRDQFALPVGPIIQYLTSVQILFYHKQPPMMVFPARGESFIAMNKLIFNAIYAMRNYYYMEGIFSTQYVLPFGNMII